ncbi:MAG: glycosyltransferase [Chloroflexota bacterium]
MITGGGLSPGQIEQISAWIAGRLSPQTVLHVGCGQGALIAGLRAAGVPAQGIDLPDALAGLPDALAPYCRAAGLPGQVDGQVDLVVCFGRPDLFSPQSAPALLDGLCRCAGRLLFLPPPYTPAAAGAPLSPGQPDEVRPSPGWWAAEFARRGFYHALDQDPGDALPGGMLFRKGQPAPAELVWAYEDRLWQARWENEARRALEVELSRQISEREENVMGRAAAFVREATGSTTYRFTNLLIRLSLALFPLGSLRRRAAAGLMARLLDSVRLGPWRVFRADLGRLAAAMRFFVRHHSAAPAPRRGRPLAAAPVPAPPPSVPAHTEPVDVVVCVHNALPDVQACLAALLAHTPPPFSLVLVDDGSEPQTAVWLDQFAVAHPAQLLRNAQARGYTCAANQGLRAAQGEFVVLLNSDTIVAAGWLDRLLACARSDPHTGLVGPLSNTASWQSIPELHDGGDWAHNPLPAGMDVDEMAALAAHYSARLYPEVRFLNGFCLLIRRQVIEQVGWFDEENFGQGYGEEDDYALRARQAGWKLRVADDVYIYHAQSRSYSHARRKELVEQSGRRLFAKHGRETVEADAQFSLQHRELAGIRAAGRQIMERRQALALGRARYAGKRLLALLPVAAPGGGANIVFAEVRAMRAMGVEVQIFNLEALRPQFCQAYPDVDLPLIFGAPEQLSELAAGYDALLATYNIAVPWLAPALECSPRLAAGYYVQDFEPLFYPPGSPQHQAALASYTLLPGLRLLAKTAWTRDAVRQHTGAVCRVVGPSLDVDLFRPRPRGLPGLRPGALRLGAMVRPSTPYRSPALTMQVLRELYLAYGEAVELIVFGAERDEIDQAALPTDFDWKLAGVLSPRQAAALMNELDIFVDFSSHQAMGLSALEAMACGAAVALPQQGGAAAFARHDQNALLVDTRSVAACLAAARRLVDDAGLRQALQRQAMLDAQACFPEAPALQLLSALFDG